VQNRLCLNQEYKVIADVVYERNVIFLNITGDHTRIVGLKISATRKQTVGVILGTQRFIRLRRFSTHLFQKRSADSRYRLLSVIPTY
jgi:hypothetical protein